jgi:hypothetical protein
MANGEWRMIFSRRAHLSPAKKTRIMHEFLVGEAAKRRNWVGVPSMYDSLEVKVFPQPDGGEG